MGKSRATRSTDRDSGSKPTSGRAVVVHGLAEAELALQAAALEGVPVTLINHADAALFAGPAWFLDMTRQAQANWPDVDADCMFDSGGAAGRAMLALELGAGRLVYDGPAAASLQALARICGAELLASAPPVLDLRLQKDPGGACRDWLRAGDI